MLWFMSLNALETFQTNYAIFHLNTSSAGGIAMTLISGAASVVGFLVAGPIADKIGRKWTITTGLAITVLGVFIMCFIGKGAEYIKDGILLNKFPVLLYVV